MSSGNGEMTFTSTFMSEMSTANYTMGGRFQFTWENTVLLCVILVVCAMILMLLVCIIVFVCCRWIKHRKRQQKKVNACLRTVLISKTTSMTGLDEDRRFVAKVFLHGQRDSMNVDNQNHPKHQSNNHTNEPKLVHTQQKLLTSTPAVKTDNVPPGKSSAPLVNSPQSTICDNDITKHDLTQTKSILTDGIGQADPTEEDVQRTDFLKCQTPNCSNSDRYCNDTEWQTGNDNLSTTKEDSPSSQALYDTATSELFSNNVNCDKSAIPYQDDIDDDYKENHSLLDKKDEPLTPPDFNETQSPTGVSTSLPLDAFGHPRAWFVPLDGLYHEPLRHSFIDVSNHDMKDFVRGESSKYHKAHSENSRSPQGTDTHCDVFMDREEDNSADWRDSGITTSHMNVRSSNSSESEGKKASAWEQREHRPVLFIEKREDAIPADT